MSSTKQSGFTMVEVLVAVTVTTAMILVLSNFLMQNLRTSTLEAAKAALLSEAQLTLDSVTTDVRLSANADQNNRNPDSNSPGGPSNQFGWTSNGSTLVLATAATTTSGSIIFADAAQYITVKNNIIYFVSNGTLYKRTLAASVSGNRAKTSCPATKATTACPADKEMMKNVQSFSVTYHDGDNNVVSPTSARSVEVSLTASANRYKQAQTVSYKTRMVFRND